MIILKSLWDRAKKILRLQLSPVNHTERLVASAGGFLGIFLVMLISTTFVDPGSAALIVASMGSSAVLLFATPHGAMSQPWPLIGGHLVSAVIGVTCARFIPSPLIAPAAAVSLAIGAMHLFKCIHPPGGATAMAAAVGGDAVHSLGYQFVLTPVMLNALIILIIAIVFTYPFSRRRYPAGWARLPGATQEQAEFVAALRKMDGLTDATEQDLLRIHQLATQAGERREPLG